MAVGCAGGARTLEKPFLGITALDAGVLPQFCEPSFQQIEFRWSANSAVLPLFHVVDLASHSILYPVQALSGLLGRTGISLFGRDFMSSRRSWAARAMPQAKSTQRNQGWAGFLIRLTAASAIMTTRKTARWMTKPRSGGSLNFSCCGVERVRFAIRRPLTS